jgi:hypothetical protein
MKKRKTRELERAQGDHIVELLSRTKIGPPLARRSEVALMSEKS